jgi:hypothetical protein
VCALTNNSIIQPVETDCAQPGHGIIDTGDAIVPSSDATGGVKRLVAHPNERTANETRSRQGTYHNTGSVASKSLNQTVPLFGCVMQFTSVTRGKRTIGRAVAWTRERA